MSASDSGRPPGRSLPQLPPDAASAVVAQSWGRSEAAGLRRDRSSQADFLEDIDLQRRMVQCARPVLDRLQEELSGMPLSIALTDEHAQVMLRSDLDRSLTSSMDDVCFAPGFDYSENVVGTNGVGTAIAAGMAVYIDGEQHFNHAIRHFTCAGAPIRDPHSGRLEGIVDISSLAKDASPLMRQLAQRAARDIETGLRETGTAKQQAVLDAFLTACRRRRTAVYSLSCGTFMSNALASTLIEPIDEAFIREEAHAMLVPSHLDKAVLILPSGRTVALRRQLIADGTETAGLIIEVTAVRAETVAPPRARARVPLALPGVVGTSPQWSRASTAVAECAALNNDVLITGEPGSGRATLARGAHMKKNPLAPIAAVACTEPDAVVRVGEALRSNATCIVLCDVDGLDVDVDKRVAELIAADQRTYLARWIVATAHKNFDGTGSRVAQCFDATIEVPALRHHPDDIADLTRAYASRIAPNRAIEISDDVVRILRKYQWPGNVTDLIQVVRSALRARPAGTVVVEDLPSLVHAAPRRSVTAMETVERDTIVKMLQQCDGNRSEAAKMLGISRSSLYRKLATYGINI